MHLKELELYGFKSFPDKIKINFNDGITAIVGPNGSGKSNVADAIRWVLGEQSTKTLRGVKMEDVIFNGTQGKGRYNGRKPLGYAEVSLTIDNSDSTLPIEFTEVTVTRRYYRSGESEYFINRTPVRLKDINELFMDTGLGRDGYSIIGQGRIAEILSVKSEDRRQIFEEAAGISKYRYRKADSERKLAAAQENIERLSDIVSELEGRLEPLRIQSEKAKEYLSLRDEKKDLEIAVWLENIDKIKLDIKKHQEDLGTARAALSAAENEILSITAKIDQCFKNVQDSNVAVDNVRNKIRETEEESAEKQNSLAVIDNDILHNNEKIERLETEISGFAEKAAEIEKEIEDKKALAESLTKKASEIENELFNIISEASKNDEVIKQQSDKISELNDKLRINAENSTALKIEQSSLLSAAEGHNNMLSDFENELQNRRVELEKAAKERNECNNKITEMQEKQASLGNIINGYKLRIETKTASIKKGEAEIAEQSSKLSAKLSRLNTLTDMEKHYEGLSGSIKTIMNESKRGSISGIHGPVSSLLSVGDKYSLAIETALGGAIQNIVTESEASAKSAINYLKQSNAGRATFLPLTSVNGKALSPSEFSGSDGFVGIASSLISFDKKYINIFSSLLGRTVIVETLDNAVSLAKKTGYKNRVVTLDGQVVNAGGSLTGGSHVKNAGILSRANEIARLKEETEKMSAQIEEKTASLKEKQASLAKETAYIDATAAESRILDEELIRENTNLSHYDILIESINASLLESDNEKKSILEKINDAKKKLAEIDNSLSALSKEEDTVRAELSIISGSGEDYMRRKEQLSEEASNARLEIISIKKDIESAISSMTELTSRKQEQFLIGDSRKNEIEAVKAENEELSQRKAEISSSINALKEEIGNLNAQISDIISSRESAEAQITTLRNSEKEKNEIKNRLVAENERLDGKIESINREYDNLILKLWDEYELSYSEAKVQKKPFESLQKATKRINEIKAKIHKIGNVNIASIEEYKSVYERYEFMSGQINDLLSSKEELIKIINDLTSSMKTIFSKQFKVINDNFGKTFKELFGGGSAQLELSDPSDVLLSGIEIKVAPPGKIIKHLNSLSGGEQAFVAIALYFAILNVRPTPFCVLDEIEAALDDVNVVRFAEYLRRLTKDTQFIAITHRRGTMEEADVLYGVTMQEEGVSKMLTINVNEIETQMNLN